MARLFITYALITAVPVVILGLVLAASYRSEATQRGISEGRSEAVLVARTAVEPVLDGRPLSQGLSPAETAAMRRLVKRAVGDHDVLRLRLRNLAGYVVFSDDGSGFALKPEGPAHAAATYGTVTPRLTRLNADDNDVGPIGPQAVEVYQPLYAGTPVHRVGVLEMYLPYAPPIAADVEAGLGSLYRDLLLGLGALYLALFIISVSVSRRLRHQVKVNKFLAEHDPLTALPNRSLFHQRVEEAVVHAVRSDSRAAIAIVDLDRFKEVNDTLGHDSGDQLLTQLAQRLADHTRPQDAVARLGGDEFGVILSEVGDAEEVLRRLRDIIEHEVEVSGLPLSVESSIGYVLSPDDGIDVDDLMQHADVAMYVAKAQHWGVVRYDAEHDHYDAANLGLIADLRRAIDADELVMHYQPKAALEDGHVEAVEALVRWQHPTLGLLYPDRFIPMCEQTDLIDRLTTWVMRRSLTDIRDLGDVAVSVNVSARTLGRARFADQVIAVLADLDVPAERLIIEITETALLTDPPRAAAVLAQLDAIGVRVSLDDFGIGQTSLGYLSSLPVHELKIDKSFVTDMMANPAHAAIVRSIVDLGHNLSLQVVGEGVETDDVFATLREAGCDLAQGFLLARPMSAEALRGWLIRVPYPPPTRLNLGRVPSWAGGQSPPRRARGLDVPAEHEEEDAVPLSWSGALAGRIDEHVITSAALGGNPLGDPMERPLWVYVPPGYDDDDHRLPSIYIIQGYTGSLTMWANRQAYRQPFPESADALFSTGQAPPCVVVWVDAWTAYGGSQFVDSTGTGKYHSYLCDDVVPFVDPRYRTLASPAHRGIQGKSSGGFGAMITPMLRPDLFGALATHAGDALYECCYIPEFPKVVRALHAWDGDIGAWWEDFQGRPAFTRPEDHDLLMVLGVSACFSAQDDGTPVLPFDPGTGRLREDVWARWLAWDPVRMVPIYADALRSLRAVWIDGGTRDEWYLDLGATASGAWLTEIGVTDVHFELFDAGHGGIGWRYPLSLAYLAQRLAVTS